MNHEPLAAGQLAANQPRKMDAVARAEEFQLDGDTLCWRIESPIGPLVLAGDGEVITHIRFHGSREAEWRDAQEPFAAAIEQLRAYFAGELNMFSLPLKPHGPAFHQRVWKALLDIPYGETTSYGAIAKQLGAPGAARAVGAANGANPIPVVIPCHRVIGASGKLTGFGGGLDVKEKLLRLESRQLRML